MIINQSVRKFEIMGLQNGQIFDLNNDNYFLNFPKGLGIKIKNEYFRLGTLQIKTNSEVEYQDISGNLLIKDYELYEQFRKFIAINRNAGFRLFYTPKHESLKRYLDCDFKEITKTELETTGDFNSNIIITPKTAWLKDTQYEFNFIKSEQVVKKYPYKYPYRYASTGLGETTLVNNGDFEIPLEIRLNGTFVKPYLRLFDVNNNIIQSCLYDVEVLENEQFIINSNPEDLGANLINVNNDKFNKQDKADFEKDLYITLPVGTYTLKISDQNENEIAGVVLAKEEYLGA